MTEQPPTFRRSFLITALLLAFFLVSSSVSYAFSFKDLLPSPDAIPLVSSAASDAFLNANKGMQVVGNSALQALSFESIKSFIPDFINKFASNLNCSIDQVIGREPTSVCANSPAVLASKTFPTGSNLASVETGGGALSLKDKPAASSSTLANQKATSTVATAPQQLLPKVPAPVPSTAGFGNGSQLASVSGSLHLSSSEFAAIQLQLAALAESIRNQVPIQQFISGGGGGSRSVDLTAVNASISGLSSSIATVAASSADVSNVTAGVLSVSHGGTGTSTLPTFGKVLLGNAAGGYDLVSTSSLGIIGGGSGGTSTINSGVAGQLAYYAADGTAVSGISTSSLGFITSDIIEGSNLYYTDARSRSAISSSALGITYASSTGILSLTSGFNIPLSASTTDWASFFAAPSSRITAGNLLSWTGSTLNVSTSSLGLTTTDISEGSNLYYTPARASTTAMQVVAAATSTVRNFISSSADGLTYAAGTGIFSLTSGYSIPLIASTTDWNAAYNNRIAGATAPLSISSNTISIAQASSTADGYLSAAAFAIFSAKESAIAASTTSSYFRGDKTFQALDTSVVPENGNLYFTAVRASTTAEQVVAAATSTVRNFISSSADGLTYAAGTGIFSLTSGYAIPLSASSTEWSSFFNTPSSRVAAGNLLSWSGNTLNVSTSSLGMSTTDISEGSNLYYTPARASTTAIQVLAATTSLPNITTLAGLTSAPSLALSASANITSGVLPVARGGTGTTTAPTLGQLLMGNSSSGYNLVSTSSLGIISSQWTSSSTDIYRSTGSVGIGTTSPGSKLDIWGSLRVGTSSTPNLLVNTATGFVGINTALPTTALDVAGDFHSSGTISSDGNLYAYNGALSLGEVFGDIGLYASGQNIRFDSGADTIFSHSEGVELARLTSQGYFGIGTAGPSEALDVIGNAKASAFLGNSFGTGNVGAAPAAASGDITLLSEPLDGDTISIYDGTGTLSMFEFDNNAIITNNGITFGVTLMGDIGSTGDELATVMNTFFPASSVSDGSGSVHVTLDDSGFLGNTPISATGDVSLSGMSGGSDGDGYIFGIGNTLTASGAGIVGSGITNSIANSLQIGPSNAAKLTILTSGNLGVGTSTPTAMLSLQGSTTAPARLLFLVASSTGSNLFNILASGNVGIGTSTPESKLTVGGDINLTGSIYQNGVLFSAGSSQAFATSTLGNDFSITTVGATSTFNMPTASASNRGLLSSSDWSIFNAKISSQWTASGSSIYYNTGNIGVGSTSPTALFTLTGTTTSPTATLFDVASSTFASLFRVTSAGTVGIGSTTPAAMLSVLGSAAVPTRPLFMVASSTGASLFSILSNGNVGIGTTPGNAFHIEKDNAMLLIDSNVAGETGIKLRGNSDTETAQFTSNHSTGEVRIGGTHVSYFPTFYSGNAEAMRINTAGNVGIGTTNPTQKLTLSGNFGITGDIAVTGDISAGNITATGNISYGSLMIGTTTQIAAFASIGGSSAYLPPTFASTKSFYDTFSEVSDVANITTHTPDIGTSWTVLIETISPGAPLKITASTDTINAIADADDGKLYTADATPPSADYEVSVLANGVSSVDDYLNLGARIQDSNNMYMARFSSTAANNTLYKKVAGTWTLLGTATQGVLAGDILKIRVVGSQITVYRNDVQMISVIDTSISAAGKGGLGIGDIGIVTTDDTAAAWVLDNFTITQYETPSRAAFFSDDCVVSLRCTTSQSLTQITQTNEFSTGATLGIIGQALSNSGLSIQIASTTAGAYALKVLTNGGATTSLIVTGAGNVGIGTSTPLYNLHVQKIGDGPVAGFTDANGTCTVDPTSTSLICSSDSRLKKDISPILSLSALDKVRQLQGVNYRWLNQSTTTLRFGFIAQDIEQIFPELVQTDVNGYKSVAYTALTPVLAEAIKELDIRVDALSVLVGTSTSTATASSSPVISSIAQSVKTLLQDMGEWVVVKITAPFASFKRVEVETASVSNGLEMKDAASGQVWCVRIMNGDWNKVLGSCADAATTTSQVSGSSVSSSGSSAGSAAPTETTAASSTEPAATTMMTSVEVASSTDVTAATTTEQAATPTPQATEQIAPTSEVTPLPSEPASVSDPIPVVTEQTPENSQ